MRRSRHFGGFVAISLRFEQGRSEPASSLEFIPIPCFPLSISIAPSPRQGSGIRLPCQRVDVMALRTATAQAMIAAMCRALRSGRRKTFTDP